MRERGWLASFKGGPWQGSKRLPAMTNRIDLDEGFYELTMAEVQGKDPKLTFAWRSNGSR